MRLKTSEEPETRALCASKRQRRQTPLFHTIHSLISVIYTFDELCFNARNWQNHLDH